MSVLHVFSRKQHGLLMEIKDNNRQQNINDTFNTAEC